MSKSLVAFCQTPTMGDFVSMMTPPKLPVSVKATCLAQISCYACIMLHGNVFLQISACLQAVGSSRAGSILSILSLCLIQMTVL
jgi:hypothetical protein